MEGKTMAIALAEHDPKGKHQCHWCTYRCGGLQILGRHESREHFNKWKLTKKPYEVARVQARNGASAPEAAATNLRCRWCSARNFASKRLRGIHEKAEHRKAWAKHTEKHKRIQQQEYRERMRASRNGTGRPSGSTEPAHPYKDFARAVRQMVHWGGLAQEALPSVLKGMDEMRDDNKELRGALDRISANVMRAGVKERKQA
jgi:hypothetical protein